MTKVCLISLGFDYKDDLKFKLQFKDGQCTRKVRRKKNIICGHFRKDPPSPLKPFLANTFKTFNRPFPTFLYAYQMGRFKHDLDNSQFCNICTIYFHVLMLSLTIQQIVSLRQTPPPLLILPFTMPIVFWAEIKLIARRQL